MLSILCVRDHDFLGQHFLTVLRFENFSGFGSSALWGLMYRLCAFIKDFDMVLCNAYATKVTR